MLFMKELKILFATDFSPNSKIALDFLKKLESVYQADINLIHVVQSVWKDWLSSGEYKNEAVQRLKTWQAELSEKQQDKNLMVKYGNPADIILQTANDKKANLVLLGGKKSNNGGRYKTGATVENITRYSDKSVWICKNNTVSKILCGIDGSESSATALKFAMDIARRFSAKLSIISALPDCHCNPLGMTDREVKKCEEKFHKEAIEGLNEFLKQFDFSGIPLETHFIPGIPANIILDRAEDFDYDLIVVGAKGHSLLHHVLMGSTAEKILRYAPCSLLVIR